MEVEDTTIHEDNILPTEANPSKSSLKCENAEEMLFETHFPENAVGQDNSVVMDNEEQYQQLPQDNKEETGSKRKPKPKRGRRKERLKRKKKERASKLATLNESMEKTDFAFMRKRRQDLTLGAKVKVLEMLDHEPRVAQGRIASVFRVSQSQVSRIMKNKEAIMAQWNQFATPERKRCRLGKAGALEQKLVDWYKEARKENLPMSGPILMEKAKSIGVEMGIEFKPTAGWLGRWKDRNGINLKVFREKDGTQSVSKVANHWRRYMFAKATKDILFQNIWVVDETVLLYDLVPEFVLPRTCGGNDQMSVILACNIAGTERKPPAVVGTVQSLEYVSLPLPYYCNTKGEITLDCFSLWLRDWDRELRSQKKKIVVLLSRAHHHPENLHLFNISITYFPVGTAKVLQPLQLGIISCFKGLYRHQQLKHAFSKAQANDAVVHSHNVFNHNNTLPPPSVVEKISSLDAIYMICKAWKHVSPDTIVKGAVKAGLSKDVDALKVKDTVIAPLGINQEDFDTFVNADLECNRNQSETENADTQSTSASNPYQNYANNTHGKLQHIDQQPTDSTAETLPTLPKASEALLACQVLRRYLQHQGGRLLDEFMQLESAVQLDMILEVRPDLKNFHIADPFHDSSSVHSFHAHKQAENAKLEHLQKVQNAHDQKTLQKGMKKASNTAASTLPLENNAPQLQMQEVRSGIIPHTVEIQRHDIPMQEIPRQNVTREEIQQPIQRLDLVHQEMMRPEYRQDIPIDRSRPAIYEMRPINMSTVYRPVQPSARNNPNDLKTGALSTVPTDLRTLPLANHRMGATSHHPGHTSELQQNIRQPDGRLENAGLPYYTIQNPLHHYMQHK